MADQYIVSVRSSYIISHVNTRFKAFGGLRESYVIKKQMSHQPVCGARIMKINRMQLLQHIPFVKVHAVKSLSHAGMISLKRI